MAVRNTMNENISSLFQKVFNIDLFCRNRSLVSLYILKKSIPIIDIVNNSHLNRKHHSYEDIVDFLKKNRYYSSLFREGHLFLPYVVYPCSLVAKFPLNTGIEEVKGFIFSLTGDIKIESVSKSGENEYIIVFPNYNLMLTTWRAFEYILFRDTYIMAHVLAKIPSSFSDPGHRMINCIRKNHVMESINET